MYHLLLNLSPFFILNNVVKINVFFLDLKKRQMLVVLGRPQVITVWLRVCVPCAVHALCSSCKLEGGGTRCYTVLFTRIFGNLFILRSRNNNAIDIETKQTKVSIIRKFLHEINVKRTSLVQNFSLWKRSEI